MQDNTTTDSLSGINVLSDEQPEADMHAASRRQQAHPDHRTQHQTNTHNQHWLVVHLTTQITPKQRAGTHRCALRKFVDGYTAPSQLGRTAARCREKALKTTG